MCTGRLTCAHQREIRVLPVRNYGCLVNLAFVIQLRVPLALDPRETYPLMKRVFERTGTLRCVHYPQKMTKDQGKSTCER